MVEEFVKLRNQLHRGEFRFDVSPEVWEWDYTGRPGVEVDDVISVYRDSELKGYAIACLSDFESDLKVYLVLELCATDAATANELIDKVVTRGNRRNADFILIRGCGEPFERSLGRLGFLDFNESVILGLLLNPRQLLAPLCSEGVQGRRVNLEIQGAEPIGLVVGKGGLGLCECGPEAQISLSLDSRVFLKLFFGRTSIWNEILRGHVRIKGKVHILTAARLFRTIRQDRWYIPSGDWV